MNVSKNYKPQAGNVAITKRALIELRKAFKTQNLDAMLVNCVYDEIVVSVSETQAEYVEGLMKQIMIDAGKYYIKTVPVAAEIDTLDAWSKP